MRIFALLLTVSVSAWGPITHFNFACDSIGAPSPCVCASPPTFNATSYLLGALSPDAFLFGSAPFIQNSKCPASAGELHNPLFGGFLMRSAKSVEELWFATGFVTHVVSDIGAFGFPEGYLASNSISGGVDWAYTWPKMITIDSYVVRTFPCSPEAAQASFPTQSLSPALIDFVAAATVQFSKIDPTIPVLNSTQVSDCSTEWAQNVNFITSVSARTSNQSALEQLQVFSPYNVTSPEEAVAALQVQQNCMQASVGVWLDTTRRNGTDDFALNSVVGFLASQYAAGRCVLTNFVQPTSTPTPTPTPSPDDGNEGSIGAGEVAGIAVATLVAGLFIGAAGMWFVAKKSHGVPLTNSL